MKKSEGKGLIILGLSPFNFAFAVILFALAVSLSAVMVTDKLAYSERNSIQTKKQGVVVKTEAISEARGVVVVDSDDGRIVFTEPLPDAVKYAAGDEIDFLVIQPRRKDGTINQNKPAAYQLVD